MDTWIFFKWIFKTFVAVFIVTHTFDLVVAVFDVAQHIVQGSAGVIGGNANIDISSVTANLETTLQAMEIPELLGLCVESLLIGLTMKAMSLCIFIIVYGRMLEIYLMCSVGPVPSLRWQTGMGADRHQLLKKPVRAGLPRLPHYVLRGDLRRAGTDHFHRRGYTRRYLGLRGVHAAFVLRPVQDRHTGKIHLQRPLRGRPQPGGLSSWAERRQKCPLSLFPRIYPV